MVRGGPAGADAGSMAEKPSSARVSVVVGVAVGAKPATIAANVTSKRWVGGPTGM